MNKKGQFTTEVKRTKDKEFMLGEFRGIIIGFALGFITAIFLIAKP